MTYTEAWALTTQLAADPSSHVAAAIHGWAHPWSHEAIVLANLYDLYVAAHTKKGRTAKTYPRPWDVKKQVAWRPKVTQSQVRAALAARGHTT